MSELWLLSAFLGWAAAWALNSALATRTPPRFARIIVPLWFMATVLFVWEGLVRGWGVSPETLPAPSRIVATMLAARATLGGDLVHTLLIGALGGWVLGAGIGLALARLAARMRCLRCGLRPAGAVAMVLPLVALAAVLPGWLGPGWPPALVLAAVLAAPPVLLGALAGRADGQRLPALFAGLKAAAALAVSGAIMAEYVGAQLLAPAAVSVPGVGFRIAAELGGPGMEMIWAEVVAASVAGVLFHALLSLCERRLGQAGRAG